ncbi:HAD-IIIA family hydrolase [Bdellovibrio bacteriovorus]|uniref:HAD-IIIA family hydrolase n=1 Tax=Bdellovibrio TaxID=958 RepID=UPI0035A99F06
MMQWETLILETVQLGGSLVFIEDKAPDDLATWLEPLHRMFLGEIPFVRRRAHDLVSGRLQTSYQDLVIIFPSQMELLATLNPALQGQRLLVTTGVAADKNPLLDFTWSSCTPEAWTHIWQKLHSAWTQALPVLAYPGSHEAPCLFLDRDDVVVKNVPYNKDPSLVELMPGIETLLSQAHEQGYWVALVTNQSGLGRGWISWREYQQVHQKMLSLLAKKGCWIDECVWAGYYDQEPVQQGRQYAGLRKPRAGMFQLVNSKLNVNLKKSVMVGDSASDLIAAFGAGVGNMYLFSSEKFQKEQAELAQFKIKNPALHFSVVKDFSEIKI